MAERLRIISKHILPDPQRNHVICENTSQQTQRPAEFEPLLKGSTYEEIVANFKWNIPEFVNQGYEVCDKHVARGWGHKTALIYEPEPNQSKIYTFSDMKRLSDKFSRVLLEVCQLKKGDRICILLSQNPETAIAHVGAWKAGMLSIPLTVLFGPDALAYRLGNSESSLVVTSTEKLQTVLDIAPTLPHLKHIIVVDESGGTISDTTSSCPGFYELLDSVSSEPFDHVKTRADDPCYLMYTSGTTGDPKGTVHAHRSIIAHIPCMELCNNMSPRSNDIWWTPSDWSWIAGLMDVLMPAWYHGCAVVGTGFRAKFDPREALSLMKRLKINVAFLVPSALKMMQQVPDIKNTYGMKLDAITSGGETMGAAVLKWGEENFSTTINEMYGQTECNLCTGNSYGLYPVKPGSMGRAIPGRIVQIIDEKGNIKPVGEAGEIAVKSPDPIMFLEYWKKPEATKNKFIGDWMITGDMGRMDEDGYFYFFGRDDDIITSGGYRIGPAEIEKCLALHPAVQLSGVVGKPDPKRTEIVKAFIILSEGVIPTDKLIIELKSWVRERLGSYEYPREIEFRTELPMTTTGKIRRKTLKEEEIAKAKK